MKMALDLLEQVGFDDHRNRRGDDLLLGLPFFVRDDIRLNFHSPIIEAPFEQEARVVLDNLDAIARASGLSFRWNPFLRERSSNPTLPISMWRSVRCCSIKLGRNSSRYRTPRRRAPSRKAAYFVLQPSIASKRLSGCEKLR
jgi:hypothetical protein